MDPNITQGIDIDIPESVGSGKYVLVLNFDYNQQTAARLIGTASILTEMANVVAGIFSHESLKEPAVIQRMIANNVEDITGDYIDKIEENKNIHVYDKKVYYTLFDFENEDGSKFTVSVPYQLELYMKVQSFIMCAVLLLGALVILMSVFPKPTKAVFKAIGDLAKDAGSAVSTPVKEFMWPLAIVAGVFVLLFFFLK